MSAGLPARELTATPDARTPRPGWVARHPEWPIVALLAGYPLWWALGIADYMFALLAIPMAVRMISWRAHGRRIKVPPGFGFWLLFLLWVAAGVTALTLTAPGTVPGVLSHKVISFCNRGLSYAGVSVLLLYAGNLTERELARRRLAWLLGLLAVYATAGGLAALFAPRFGFSSPALLLMPHSLQANVQVQASMHPALAQIQNVLGAPGGRPKAPFDYTNTWGNCLAILLPWLIAGWWSHGTRRHRRIAVLVLLLCLVPAIYSLNRGLWIGLGVALCYAAVRFAARGRMALLGLLCGCVVALAVLIVATPLRQVITTRLANGQSNSIRSSLTVSAVRAAEASPVLGFGDTRAQAGSPQSIAVGPTAGCGNCGQIPVGSNGQLWLLLICNGFVGAAFYLAFFASGSWRYRHDSTPVGIAGGLVLLLSFVFMLAYDAVGAPLAITMLSYALLWRNDTAEQPRTVSPERKHARWPVLTPS
ncbi:MAG: O-antigen ligase family protein [Actinobacteria bacterium]|nr:O-antigen ligase family protein [Actinomycetota bacterium]MBO0784598.1 O-antigen ligase family protein [Actinomycetota bacterium]